MLHTRYMSRMPDGPIFPVKKLVSLTDALAQQITDFRYDQRLPSDNEAIRRLIELGLKAARGEKP